MLRGGRRGFFGCMRRATRSCCRTRGTQGRRRCSHRSGSGPWRRRAADRQQPRGASTARSAGRRRSPTRRRSSPPRNCRCRRTSRMVSPPTPPAWARPWTWRCRSASPDVPLRTRRGGRSHRSSAMDEAAERVAAAAEAAHGGPVHLVLTARAENYLHGRPDLADTIARLQAFEAAGADVLYAPGLRDARDIRTVVESVGLPVNVLAMPGVPPVRELSAIGVRRVSVGGAFTWVAIDALVTAAHELLDEGTYGYLEAAGRGGAASGVRSGDELQSLAACKSLQNTVMQVDSYSIAGTGGGPAWRRAGPPSRPTNVASAKPVGATFARVIRRARSRWRHDGKS